MHKMSRPSEIHCLVVTLQDSLGKILLLRDIFASKARSRASLNSTDQGSLILGPCACLRESACLRDFFASRAHSRAPFNFTDQNCAVAAVLLTFDDIDYLTDFVPSAQIVL